MPTNFFQVCSRQVSPACACGVLFEKCPKMAATGPKKGLKTPIFDPYLVPEVKLRYTFLRKNDHHVIAVILTSWWPVVDQKVIFDPCRGPFFFHNVGFRVWVFRSQPSPGVGEKWIVPNSFLNGTNGFVIPKNLFLETKTTPHRPV